MAGVLVVLGGMVRSEPVQPEAITLFVTGQTLGTLKPCGCSGGQLGGLDRRPALFNQVQSDKRLILDVGALVKQDQEQDLLKFRIIWRAFQMLGYDVVALNEQDLRITQALGLFAEDSPVPLITAIPPPEPRLSSSFTKDFTLEGQPLRVKVLAVDGSRPPADAGTGREVTIWVLGDPLNAGGGIPQEVDCVLCPADGDEPRLAGDPNARPVVVSMGRYGRHVVRLDISLDKGIPRVRFGVVPVKEDFSQDAAMKALYQNYQELVSQAGLIDRFPKVPLPDDLEYAGSTSCKECHQSQYQVWTSNKHSRAYATLQNVGSDRDPECVLCHVVGLEFETGFVSSHETPDLKDVGCEFCHGAGSSHNRTKGKAKMPLGPPKPRCLTCHTPEHSGGYAGHETEYLEKIRHWKEPNAPGDVK